jgi:hypothetical protein
MKADKLITGRTYFMCGYFFRHRPIPEIESWIYVGVDQESDGMWHRFQDPISFHAKEWLAEVSEGEDRTTPEERIIRVRHEDIEMVYSLSELEEFVTTLRNEPRADETF